jgi:hypothetical protein
MHMNLRHYFRCKPPTYFGHLLWLSSGRHFFFEKYVTTTTLMYSYTLLICKYVINSIC